MRKTSSLVLPFALVALGMAVFAGAFLRASRIFGGAVHDWAARELDARVELAADNLKGPLSTGDFRAMREFGEVCRAAGEQLIVLSGPGGLVYDSLGSGVDEANFIYRARSAGEFTVRLGLPLERVLSPQRRANRLFAYSSVTGAAAMLLVFYFVYRQRLRISELARVERFRRDFIVDISHELKTPLTGILGSVDLLEDESSLPQEAKAKLLGMVKRESMRLNDLAQNILSLSRLERTQGMATFAAADLCEVVCETVERFSVKAAAAGVALKTRLPYADSGAVAACVVRCDAQLVAQALANLVENALRYSGSPEVTVALGREAAEVTLSVEDRGCGVPPEHRERLFERFYRVDAARSAETGGSGLGLAIVQGIARLHGGEAAYEPVEPTGSRFVLRLPCNGNGR